MQYTVYGRIVGLASTAEPVDVQWYKGDNLALAIAAAANAAARYEDDDDVPETARVKTLEVRIEYNEEA